MTTSAYQEKFKEMQVKQNWEIGKNVLNIYTNIICFDIFTTEIILKLCSLCKTKMNENYQTAYMYQHTFIVMRLIQKIFVLIKAKQLLKDDMCFRFKGILYSWQIVTMRYMFVFARILTLYAMLFWWLPDYLFMTYDMFTSDAWYLAVLEDAESGVLDLRVSWLNYWVSWLMHVILVLIGPCILTSLLDRIPDQIGEFNLADESPWTFKKFTYMVTYGVFMILIFFLECIQNYIAGEKNVMHEWIMKDLLPEDQ